MQKKNENPLGIIQFEALSFCLNNSESSLFETLKTFGFIKTHEHTNDQTCIYSQGKIKFIINYGNSVDLYPRNYLASHGEAAYKMTFLVEDVKKAYELACKGTTSIQPPTDFESVDKITGKIALVRGIEDTVIEFLQKDANKDQFVYEGFDEIAKFNPEDSAISNVDHFTVNVPFGQMNKWVEFYENVFGFITTRNFDIKGEKTGLYSKVVQSPDGSVIIPINEPDSANSKSQIQEFLDLHKGSGIQHIALKCPDIKPVVGGLHEKGIKFLSIPSTYYEDIEKRNIKNNEDVKVLEKLQLLIDGDEEGNLLQIFTQNAVGPLFFEFIQRNNNDGFGEGNFKALFEAIERDQMQRGYLK